MIQLGTIDLDPGRRRLRVRGEIVSLSARAFDVLELLLEAGGAVVAKEELFRRVWPGLVVEENNLQVHISAIRKALGKDRDLIQTVSKQGYRFMVEYVVDPTGNKARDISSASPIVQTNLSVPVSEMIGREHAVEDIVGMLGSKKIVTLTGPGGIGKTRLSLEVGHRLIPLFPDGIWLAELGSLADPLLVGGIVGNALGVNIDNRASSHQAIVEAIGNKRLLLVMDNCEHLIGAVAALVEFVARSAPNVRILATSREPLGADGEHVYAVPPLDVGDPDALPDPDHPGAACNLADSSAVALFLTRMRALTSDVPTDVHSLRLVSAICGQLDGIPLAIEIAAARAPMLGIEQLSARLDDRFRLLMDSRRTAMPRHRTLKAALDWSFDLLNAAEQAVLCTFGVFAGGFTLDAALAISPPGMPPLVAIGTVTSLVHKSLVVVDVGAAGARYRLLETTRSYAAQRLQERGEWGAVARRHLVFFAALLHTAVSDPGPERRESQLAFYRRELDNLRAAIEWAFHDGREIALGISLTVRTTPLMYDLLLVEECAVLAERALREIARSGEGAADDETVLLAVKAAAIGFTEGPTEEVAALWKRVLQHATQTGDAILEMRANWGLWNQKVYAGEPGASLQFAHARETPVANSPYVVAFRLHGLRMLGTSLHFLGDQRGAQVHLEQMVALYDKDVHYVKSVGARIDHAYASRITLARVLWLQGLFDQAEALNARNVAEIEDAAYPLLACYALLDAAIPLALMRGQWELARQHGRELDKRLATIRLPIWEVCAACFAEMAAIGSGDGLLHLPLLANKLERMRQRHYLTHLSMIQGFMAEQLGAHERPLEGLGVIEEALAAGEQREDRWCLPELGRVHGELLLKCAGPHAAEQAEQSFRRAMELANDQGALFWSLRTATSLGRLLHDQGRSSAASDLLGCVLGRFTQGFDTAEYRAARSLLAGWR